MTTAHRVRRAAGRDVRAALPGWLLGRVLVVGGWFAALAWQHLTRGEGATDTMHQGLFAWDGVFYRGLAEHGYGGEALEAIRFFPLFPLLGRALGALAAPPGLWLVVVANVGALAAGALVHRLSLEAGLGARVARHAATLAAVFPAGFVLAWAYAEGLYCALAAATLVALGRQRWWWAAGLGALAALTRPTGAFLALGAAVAVVATWRRGRRVPDGPALAAVAAPALGLGAYLLWAQGEAGSWRAPLTEQSALRGWANPVVRLAEAAADLARGDVHGLHLPFAVLLVGLAVVCVRRLPGAWSGYAVTVVVATLAAENLNSLERYTLDAVPLLVALALVTAEPALVRRATLAVSSVGLTWLTALAWLGDYVP